MCASRVTRAAAARHARAERRSPAAVIELVKQTLWSLDPKLPLIDTMPMRQQLDESLYRQRFFLRLSIAFTVIATSLAMVGVYASFAYWVSRRRREIAIRIAVGASPQSIVTSVLGRSLRLAAMGAVIGLGLALAGAQLLQSMLFEIDPRDPPTLVAVTAILTLAAIVASAVPALRASRVDPMTTLRAE